MTTRALGHVFVGVDGSLAGLRALRRAVTEARLRGSDLYVVRARPEAATTAHQVSPAHPAAQGVTPTTPGDWLDAAAIRIVNTSMQQALGGRPTDITVHCTVAVGRPGPVLASLGWRDDDLVVVGSDGGSRWRHPLHRSVGQYCVRHSHCPVLVVPPDSFAREMHETGGLHRGALRRDVWKQFDETFREDPQHIR